MFINFNDILIFLAIFISVGLGITILILLIISLVRLIKTMGKINKIIDDNAESISRTVTQLPQLTESIDRTLNSVGDTLGGVNDTFFETKSTNDMMTTVISIVESVVNLVLNLFSKRNNDWYLFTIFLNI